MDYQTKNVLICVGCGHFKGPESLLDLLRQEGFELVRMPKKGHNDPRLTSFCNYLMDYTYEDLLKEAAEQMMLKRPLPKDKAYIKVAEKKYAEDYQQFLDILKFYHQPGSENKEWGPGNLAHSVIHEKLRGYNSLIKKYKMNPDKHQFFQRSNQGDYYVDRVFSVDLEFATTLLERKTLAAKRKFC